MGLLSCLVCLVILQNRDFLEVVSAGLSRLVENTNLLSIVFEHFVEDELFVTFLQTRLFAFWTLQKKIDS